jgi:excisionase family DNA binding protein
MPVRRIRNWWWVDLRYDGTRHRKKSPLNTRAGAQIYESVLRGRLCQRDTSTTSPQLNNISPMPKTSSNFPVVQNEPFLTLVEVANYLHVSRATLYRMVDRRELRCYRVGRGLRFRQEDIRELIKKGETKSLDGI